MLRGVRVRVQFIAVVGVVAGAAFLTAVVASADNGRGSDGSKGVTTTTGQSGAKYERGGGRLLAASLAPSVPTDPAVHGVAAGAVPWVLGRGTVELRSNGNVRIAIKGLVIPVAHGTFPAGTALPVATVSASLYCAPDTAAAAATTKTVPLSADGNAAISDTIALPSTCLAPIVLVHPNGSGGAYIAATGWSS